MSQLVAGCVVLGGVLRFATLDLQSFDHDEAVSGRVIDGSFADVLSTVPESERTPPLYYVLAWLWTRVFGTGEIGARSLSAVVGTATILVAFLAVRRLFGNRVGLAAAALVAVNPLLVWNSQDARSYASRASARPARAKGTSSSAFARMPLDRHASHPAIGAVTNQVK